MRYIDIGVNLFSRQFEGSEDLIVRRAAEAGTGIIITGSSLESSLQASDYVRRRPGRVNNDDNNTDDTVNVTTAGTSCSCVLSEINIYSTAGVHPHDADSCSESALEKLKDAIKANDRIVAVGECGLDYDRMFSPKEDQLFWFERQIEMAEELGKPLFLHERSASEDFCKIMRRHSGICGRSVVHCFTGTRAEAEAYLDMGCMIGITGWVCDDRRNSDLLEALEIIPVDRLMAETDAPYLKPRGIKGLKGPNVPENIKYVVSRIASVKGADEEELAIRLKENTERFFSLK